MLFRIVFFRECRRLVRDPLYPFCMVAAPLLCCLLFTSLMDAGLPTKLPAGAVDEDRSALSRNVLRTLGAFQHTDIVAHYPDFTAARRAMQQGDIYGFYYIPQGMEAATFDGKQPTVSYYLNYSYLVAGSLLYEDMRTLSELADGAVVQTRLYARGALPWQTAPYLQPIVVETHPLGNPWLNYSVYLNNTILPGVLMLMIFLVTIYSLGTEVKSGSARRWLRLSGGRFTTALAGKLLPQTLLFVLVAWVVMGWLYGVLRFPCHCGLPVMLLTAVLMVLSAQGFALFLFALFPWMRFAMSVASLWGVVSFSISGFTFPAMAMSPALQAVGQLFPLRHYFLIYVNNALNGYPVAYAAAPYLALLLFALLPLPFLGRLKRAVTEYAYCP